MKILVSFSGGKDSQACLIQAAKQYGANNITAVFCDTGWEHPVTYKHITDTCSLMDVKLITLKSKFDFVSPPNSNFMDVYDYCIKGSVAEELADAVIRLLDLYGLRGIDLNEDAFNKLTIVEYSVTHKRKSFTESIFHITQLISSCIGSFERSAVTPEMMLLEILGFAEHLGVDLMWHIEQKMKYNQSREKMYGKKY